MNDGSGGFELVLSFGEERDMPSARGALAVDLDDNCSLELLVTRAAESPELLRSSLPEKGEDVLSRVLKIDRRHVETPKDAGFIGYAKEHWLELDFGAALANMDKNARLILYLHG